MAEPLQLESINGTVEGVIFRNDDTGFTVFEADVNEELVCVVGELAFISVGEELVMTGNFVNHPTYGAQFKMQVCERRLPATATAIRKYLASGSIKGIGPAIAGRIVEKFAEKSLVIIEKTPDKLAEVKGISLKKAREIGEEFQKLHGIRTVMTFLSAHGIDPVTSINVWKRYGTAACDLIAANPYILCEPEIGLTFEVADKIAEEYDLLPENPDRIFAALRYILTVNINNGHSCLPADRLRQLCNEMLAEVDNAIVESCYEQATEERGIVEEICAGKKFAYLPEYFAAESFIAGRVSLMTMSTPQCDIDITAAIDELEAAQSMKYAALQQKAIELALLNNVFVLTGGPGTGKTTTINAIISLFEKQNLKVGLAAPTGRAAKRMTELTSREAKTIHRLLEVDFKDKSTGLNTFKRNERNLLQYDVIIIDEMSMVDLLLFESLLKAVKMGSRVILVGDIDQLPAVGAGNILKEFIASERIVYVRLSEIFRQAALSSIVTSAHQIVKGEMPRLDVRDNDFFFLPSISPQETTDKVVDLCRSRLTASYGYSPIWDIQVLAPTRIGPSGTAALNQALQKALNPQTGKKSEFNFGSLSFREGDKVMQIKNNYDLVWQKDDGQSGMGVYNGDIGIIEWIDKSSRSFCVRFDDRSSVYDFDGAGELELAYAATVHKSQGCEFEAVIIPLGSINKKLYHRNLLYTAVTRAKKLLIIIGQAASMAYMVQNYHKNLRYTNLAAMIREVGDSLSKL